MKKLIVVTIMTLLMAACSGIGDFFGSPSYPKIGNDWMNPYCPTVGMQHPFLYSQEENREGLNKYDTIKFKVEFHFIHSTVEELMRFRDDSMSIRMIKELNDDWRGWMQFERTPYDLHYVEDIQIDTLRESFGKSASTWDDITGFEPLEEDCIYVYVVPGEGSLLGFTPVFDTWHVGYEQITPKFDKVCLSYRGARGHWHTLTHEMGHFFGLNHVFDQSKRELESNGITSPVEYCVNHMNYNCYTDNLTDEQIGSAIEFAAAYRSYLIQ